MKRGIVVRGLGTSSDFLGEQSLPSTIADYKQVFATAAENRFDGVQPYLSLERGLLRLDSASSALRGIAAAAEEAGVELPSLEIAPLQYSLISDDTTVRARGLEVVRRSLDVAGELGCRGVLVIPGAVGLRWVPGGGDQVAYGAAYQRLVEALGALATHAEKAGVAIHIENIWNMFLLSPLELVRALAEVNSGHVGALLDTGNVTQTGFAAQWVDILGPFLREVHLKDFRRAVGTVEGFVPLLSGDVDWPEVMTALQRNAYDGYLIAETFPYRTFGHVSLLHTVAALDALLDVRVGPGASNG